MLDQEDVGSLDIWSIITAMAEIITIGTFDGGEVEITGKGFLPDALRTGLFELREGVPGDLIVTQLMDIRAAYEAQGQSVADGELQTVINHFGLPLQPVVQEPQV